jgi:hypothetical protein
MVLFLTENATSKQTDKLEGKQTDRQTDGYQKTYNLLKDNYGEMQSKINF